MTARAFLDTNILVYSRDSGSVEKQAIAEALIRKLWESRTGVVSTQVMNEYFVTVTRKLKPGIPASLAWKDLVALKAWNPVSIDWILLERAQKLFTENSLSWWDAMIVAAAQKGNCGILYSEDLNDGQLFGNLLIKNPFSK